MVREFTFGDVVSRFEVHVDSFEAMIKAGEIPFATRGRGVRYFPAEVIEARFRLRSFEPDIVTDAADEDAGIDNDDDDVSIEADEFDWDPLEGDLD